MLDPALEVLRAAIGRRVFPGAVIDVGTSSGTLWTEAVGCLTYDRGAAAVRRDTVFDLASLTKVLVTTPLVMEVVEQGLLGLDDPVQRHVEGWHIPAMEAVLVRDLLAHCSGLPAVRPYFETLSGAGAVEQAICAEPLVYPPRTTSLYSDLGFMLLWFILERTTELASRLRTLLARMGVTDPLQFNPPASWGPRLAPTAFDPWRKRLLIGEVDDNNAAALGGQAGHAGVFGTAAAVASCARHWMRVLRGETGAFRHDTAMLFVSRRTDVPGSSRALGWDTMQPTSSCGTRMSSRAFGHTGFTGTSLWIDPERDRYVVVLTNRVHPDRADRGIQEVRRALHEAVMVDAGY